MPRTNKKKATKGKQLPNTSFANSYKKDTSKSLAAPKKKNAIKSAEGIFDEVGVPKQIGLVPNNDFNAP